MNYSDSQVSNYYRIYAQIGLFLPINWIDSGDDDQLSCHSPMDFVFEVILKVPIGLRYFHASIQYLNHRKYSKHFIFPYEA